MDGRLETRGLGRLTLLTLRFCELIFSGLLIPILTNNKFSSKSCNRYFQMRQRVCSNSILIIWLQRHSFEFPDMLLEGFHVSIFPETISDISAGYSQIPAFQSLRCYFKPKNRNPLSLRCSFLRSILPVYGFTKKSLIKFRSSRPPRHNSQPQHCLTQFRPQKHSPRDSLPLFSFCFTCIVGRKS
jgi:hypothetical protein